MAEFILVWTDQSGKKETRPVKYNYRESDDDCFARHIWAVKLVFGDKVRVAIVPTFDDM
jgi:hypothetical protein